LFILDHNYESEILGSLSKA